jgi:UDP:flavonoid glycosyltransferase YjiC (YdhE family)
MRASERRCTAQGQACRVSALPNGRDQNYNAARLMALGLGRILSPTATSAEIRDTVTGMLSDQVLRAACRSFAACVNRFGDLMRAADLVVECADDLVTLPRPK